MSKTVPKKIYTQAFREIFYSINEIRVCGDLGNPTLCKIEAEDLITKLTNLGIQEDDFKEPTAVDDSQDFKITLLT